jgi:putative transposase
VQSVPHPASQPGPAGDVEIGIPKLRTGSFFPELLEPRATPRDRQGLWAVIMTAHITSTSTRKVDDLEKALGCDSGILKSTVSRICAQIDADVAVGAGSRPQSTSA